MPKQFLLILYEAPKSPSRVRVKLWRKLRGLGGVYPSLSLCIVPYKKGVEEELAFITRELGRSKVIILSCRPVKGQDSKNLSMIFRESREKEYAEILEECNEFLEEIEKNLKTGNVSEEEAEELERAFESLEKWFEEVEAKGHWNARTRKDAKIRLKECKKKLYSFMSKALEKSLSKEESSPENSTHN